MFLKFQPFFLIAETPIHPGSGVSLSIVDLPIQRERHTGWPKIEASGLKGCIREGFENSRNKKIKIKEKEVEINSANISLVFGPESEGDERSHAGAIAFVDARVLLFPVKSLKGIFTWITCPQVLERFKKDMEIIGLKLPEFFKEIRERTIASDSIIIKNNQIVLEEFSFDVEKNENTNKIAEWLSEEVFPKEDEDDGYWYWREKLKNDLVILKDDEFGDFVTNSTEVITRTKISNKTGTVEEGPWTEEYLPQDTILYSIAMASGIRIENEKKDCFSGVSDAEEEAELVLEYFRNGIGKIIQIGGNQTIGKGLTRIQVFGGVSDGTSKTDR